ncbi:MAG: aminopeptidase [Oligoflexus sp.]|jgi:predicted aminopeptidase
MDLQTCMRDYVRLYIVVLLGGLLSSCYTLEQALRFNTAFNSRVPVRDALGSGLLSETTAGKLRLSRELVDFAAKQGLNTGRAYQHFIPEESAATSYFVQAAHADRFESKTWWFPIVGRVPYLGYFDSADRDREAAALRAQGFDVSIGSVGAFSSLGWFPDPIYASMTKRSDPEYIQLLLHELVHRTFWSQGSVSFNENLAEYASRVLTQRFLKERRGGEGLTELLAVERDQEKLRSWLKGLRQELEAIYSDGALDRGEKLRRKASRIAHWKTERFPEMSTPGYRGVRNRDWNNATILGASLYSPDTERFERAAGCVGAKTIGQFLEALRRAERRISDAERALDHLCVESKSDREKSSGGSPPR